MRKKRTETKQRGNEGHAFVCQFHLFTILILPHNNSPYLFKTQKRGDGGSNEATTKKKKKKKKSTHTYSGFLSLLGIWARPAVLWLSAPGLLTCQSDG